VLDPRYKMKLIRLYFSIIYPFDTTGEHVKGTLNILKKLYEVYVAAHNSSIIQQPAAVEVSVSTSMASVTEVVPSSRSRFRQHIRSRDIIRPIKIDLDIYFEKYVFISNGENYEDSDANFDALDWWKSNALKYRILSKMARDILVVPINIVAS
jgi:hypothetical protein